MSDETRSTRYSTTSVASAGTATFQRISWGAVFAGVLVAMTLQLTLSLLGLGIGLGSVDPLTERNPLDGLGMGTVIWWGLSLLISLYAGGWVAGRLAGIPRAFDSLLHGILTWCLFTILLFYLLTTAVGRIIGGVSSVVGSTFSAAGSGLASVAPQAGQAIKDQIEGSTGINLGDLQNEAEEILRQTGKPALQPDALERQAKRAGNAVENAADNAASNPQGANETGQSLINRLFGQGEKIAGAADRDAAVNVIMARTGKSRQEAEQTVDGWTKTYEQAKAKFEQTKTEAAQKAREAADATANAASKAAIYTFLGLMLGAVAAAFGGRSGEPRDDLNTDTTTVVDKR